jgi:hypothetical protein
VLQSLPEFQLDSAKALPRAWRLVIHRAKAWEKPFFVLSLSQALGWETQSARSSSVLVKQLATEWVWISWLTSSEVFAWASALVLL